MKHLKHTGGAFLTIALLLLFPFFSSAQVTLYATDHKVEPDQDFSVEVKVKNFNDIVGCQFSMAWNEDILRLKDAHDLNPSMPSAFETFNLNAADTGHLAFVWAHPALSEVSLEDDATMFVLDFEVETNQTVTDSILFVETPVAVEIADMDENVLDVTFQAGVIEVDGVSSILQRRGAETLSITSAPNPFQSATEVNLNFHRRANAAISLYAPDGKLLFSQPSRAYPTGTFPLELPGGLFRQAGTYLLKVHSTDFIISHKLMAQ